MWHPLGHRVQFPLGVGPSSITTEVLYSGLLSGEDPRWVLHQLRMRLRADLPETQDWASIVAYGTIAPDLESQVQAFKPAGQDEDRSPIRPPRRSNRPSPAAVNDAATSGELEALCESVRADIASWSADSAATSDPKQRAERLSMSAVIEKRIAVAYGLAQNLPASKLAYERARDFFSRLSMKSR